MGKKVRSARKRIADFLEQIDWMFQVNGFERDLTFMENDEQEGDCDKVAEVWFHYEYQRIDIKIFPIFFKKPLIEQRKILLHELCHTITLPSKKAMIKSLDGYLTHKKQIQVINETETSKIENMLDSLLRGRLKYAKKAYADYLKG